MDLKVLAEILDLLSEVFLDPEANLVLRSRELMGELEGEDDILDLLRRMTESAGSQSERSEEYVRLFMHGVESEPVHPYESALLYGKLMHRECLDSVNALYSSAGIRPNGYLKIPPDHLGLELEFIAFLIRRINESTPGGKDAQHWNELACKLLKDHLQKIVPVFLERLSSLNPHVYYQRASDLLVVGIVKASEITDGLRQEKIS